MNTIIYAKNLDTYVQIKTYTFIKNNEAKDEISLSEGISTYSCRKMQSEESEKKEDAENKNELIEIEEKQLS